MTKYKIGDMFLFSDKTYFTVTEINIKGDYFLTSGPRVEHTLQLDNTYWTEQEIDNIIMVYPIVHIRGGLGEILYG